MQITKEEVYDKMLAKAGKCPKCGDYLFIEIRDECMGYYRVYAKCLGKDCNYEYSVSNAFNEAMGLKKPPDPMQDFLSSSSKKKIFSSSSNIPYKFWDVEPQIDCPFCGSTQKEKKYLPHRKVYLCTCLECGREYMDDGIHD